MIQDIIYLDKVMKIKTKKDLYNNYFCWLYPFTNENIKGYYSNLNFQNKNVLTVTSSGDHIINAILKGAKEIDAFDINPLAKYYSELKISAIKSLSLEEFILFFYNKSLFKTQKYYMNKNTYFKKIRNNLSNDYKDYWDYVFNKYSSKKIYNSYLFTNDFLDLKELIKANLYMEENAYNDLKYKLKDTRITYYDKNIKEFTNGNKKYDLIILSNIPAFIDKIFDYNHLIKLKNIIERLKKDSSTVIINYYYDNLFRDYDNDNIVYDKNKIKKVFPNSEFLYFESFNNKQELFKLTNKQDAVLILNKK